MRSPCPPIPSKNRGYAETLSFSVLSLHRVEHNRKLQYTPIIYVHVEKIPVLSSVATCRSDNGRSSHSLSAKCVSGPALQQYTTSCTQYPHIDLGRPASDEHRSFFVFLGRRLLVQLLSKSFRSASRWFWVFISCGLF